MGTRARRSQSGQALVLVAVALLALIGSAALVLLAGSVMWQREQLQSLADSTALDSALQISASCNAANASGIITEADTFLATQRTRTGSLSITAGTCATPYHGTDTFAGGLSADYYYPYHAHEQQVEVVLTLTLPISFSGVEGQSSTAVSNYAVAQALPGAVPAVSATSLSCTGGQVNVAGDVTAQNAVVLSGGCALYAHARSTGGAYSSLGNVSVYADGQSWLVAGGSCAAGANTGSANAICSDGYELSGHVTVACGGTTSYLAAGEAAINADPCAAGAGPQPVPAPTSAAPPDPDADPIAVATLQGTGGAACTPGGVYPAIVAGGITWGTGQAPAPTVDAAGYWHFKPSCYGYLNFANAAGAGSISLRQVGAETPRQKHFLTPSLPGASIAGTLLIATISSDPTPNKTAPPAGWLLAADVSLAAEGRSEIWYYPNNPGGITTVTFSTNPATVAGQMQLSEWNGALAVAPLDQTGTQTIAVTSTSATLSTAGAMAQGNELVVTNFGFSAPAGQTYTPGASWNPLLADTTGFASEYRLDLPAGVASETVTTGKAALWTNAIATFKPSGVSAGGAVLDPGFYYFNGNGSPGGGGGICLNGGQLLARDVTIEFAGQAGFSSGNCLLGGTTPCIVGSCKFGSDPASGKVDTNYSWFAAPCSLDPTASPDASCLGAASWCPAGDRSCWNLLLYQPSGATGQVAIKGTAAQHWLLGSVYWPGTMSDAVNGTSTIAGAVTCGSLSISAAAGAGTAIGSDAGISTATVEAELVE